MEKYQPFRGDLVWVEGKNPESYAIMPTLFEWRMRGWTDEDSRANAEVIDLGEDYAIVKFFNGEGTEAYDFDYFSRKEDHVWKIRGELI